MKKVSMFVLMVVLCISVMVIPAFAASTSQDGLEVTLTTDKKTYDKGEQIEATLTVTNTNDSIVSNVYLENMIPDGYKLAEGLTATKQIEALDVGETISLTVIYVTEDVDNNEDKPDLENDIGDMNNSGGGNNNGNGNDFGDKESGAAEFNPGTGDNSNIVLWIVLMFVAIVGIGGIVLLKKKQGKRFLSLFLCFVITETVFLNSMIPVKAKELVEKKEFIITENIKRDESEIEISALIKYTLESFNLESSYMISFDYNFEGAPEIEKQNVKAGECAVMPEPVEREGYVFWGWYENQEETDWNKLFNFDTTIDSNLTLYAKWISTFDTDKDGLPDGLEDYYHTDVNNADTDNDGISDYDEIMSGLDPLKKDSDGNGIDDSNEDSDGDGVSNAMESENGTDLFWDDTDTDGLTDSEEINVYKTNPTEEDTDGDGASDGAEVKYHTNPLVADSIFNISAGVEEKDKVIPTLDITLQGEQVDSLHIEKVEDSYFISEDIPGYMGNAYDFYVEGGFEKATLRFEFDSMDISEDAEPTIYYFNEETQVLEELETFVDGNVASAVLEHFSTYILLNKTEFDKVWETEIKPPSYEGENQKKGLDVVLAIDSSGSMTHSDPNDLRKTAAKLFADKLGVNDRGAIVDFDTSASITCPLTNDTVQIQNTIDAVDSNGGTNLSDAVSKGIAVLTEDEGSSSKYKFIILLTDGQGRYSHTYSQSAIENDIQIYTIGLGDGVDKTLLEKIAADTCGKYYFASTADELLDIYDQTAGETIDYVTDSNNDGISDYYTKLLCEGTLTLGTGKPSPFAGKNYEDIQKNADYDGDGLLNGEELLVFTFTDDPNSVYVGMKSDPTVADTDNDKIPDGLEFGDAFKWNVSDRNLALCASMSYSFLPEGIKLSDLNESLKAEINNRFKGKDGNLLGNIDEMSDWKILETWYRDGGLQIVAFQKDKNVIFTCRGSDEGYDWFNNATTWLLGLSTHSAGTKKFMKSLMKDYKKYDFYITGHSLGGNLAYNAAVAGIAYRESAIKGIVTFNGLGLCYEGGLPGFINRKEDEKQLMKKNAVTKNYMIKGDPVSRGIVGWTSYHFGEDKVFEKHEQVPQWFMPAHSMINFIAYLKR